MGCSEAQVPLTNEWMGSITVMLDQLPVDLFRSILHDYLECDIKQLSAVDVAFCSNERRSDWLILLAQLRNLTATVKQPDRKHFPLRNLLGEVLSWMLSRKVQVSKLECETGLFTIGPVISARRPIPSVEILSISKSHPVLAEQIQPKTFESILCFLDCFPCLKTLTLWIVILDEQLRSGLRGRWKV